MIFSEERIAELNQQIYDFNHNQGDFTKEKKSEMAIEPTLINSDLGLIELGIANPQPILEGYFYDYFEKDGRLVLLIGFDGNDDSSFTTLVQFPLYYLKEQPKAKFGFRKYSRNTVFSDLSRVLDITSENISDLSPMLDSLKNRVIIMQLTLQPIPGQREDYPEMMSEYFTDRNSKIGLAGKLISLLSTNGGIEIKNEYYIEGGYESYEIIKLADLNNIENVDLIKIPMIEPSITFG